MRITFKSENFRQSLDKKTSPKGRPNRQCAGLKMNARSVFCGHSPHGVRAGGILRADLPALPHPGCSALVTLNVSQLTPRT